MPLNETRTLDSLKIKIYSLSYLHFEIVVSIKIKLDKNHIFFNQKTFLLFFILTFLGHELQQKTIKRDISKIDFLNVIFWIKRNLFLDSSDR